jgi:hypothetical protein
VCRALASFLNAGAGEGEGSLSNYRVVSIPDCLPSDSTLAQTRVLGVTTEKIDGRVFTVRHLWPQSEAVTPGVDFE